MGGVAQVAVAFPVGGTLALLAVLVFAMVSAHFARRFSDAKEPLFPDAAGVERDPVAFTEGLAKAGRFDDEMSRFADVAARSGLEQAYGLLARANANDAGARVRTATGSRLDPRRALATLATIDDEDRRLATFVAHSTAQPPNTTDHGPPTQSRDAQPAPAAMPGPSPAPDQSAPEIDVPTVVPWAAAPEQAPDTQAVEPLPGPVFAGTETFRSLQPPATGSPQTTSDNEPSPDDDLLPRRPRRGHTV